MNTSDNQTTDELTEIEKIAAERYPTIPSTLGFATEQKRLAFEAGYNYACQQKIKEGIAVLKASIAREENNKRKEGLGHQGRSEEKGLKACESFLRQASAALDGTIQTSLKARIELMITEVMGEAAGAQDMFNDNA